jgi:hypothetical protein
VSLILSKRARSPTMNKIIDCRVRGILTSGPCITAVRSKKHRAMSPLYFAIGLTSRSQRCSPSSCCVVDFERCYRTFSPSHGRNGFLPNVKTLSTSCPSSLLKQLYKSALHHYWDRSLRWYQYRSTQMFRVNEIGNLMDILIIYITKKKTEPLRDSPLFI